MKGSRATSLRARFALAMLLWVVIGLLAVGISASLLFRRHVERVFHAELQEHLVELVGLTGVDARGRPRLSRPLSDPRYGAPGSGYYWQIRRDDGAVLRSPSLPAGGFSDTLARRQRIVQGQGAGPAGPAMIYGMASPHPDGRGVLHFLVATDMRHLDDLVAGYQRELLAWLGGMALLLVAGAAAALRFATRPLDRLAGRIARVRTGQDERLGSDWPDEIAPLAADLDRLIESREAMVTSARIEAGNLAHGLRTSLAILIDEAESLADHPSGPTLRSECMVIARRLDWHLARARAAAGKGVITQTSLPDTLLPLLGAMRRLHAGIDFAASGPPVRARIDPDALAEILSNLLDNAGKWAAAGVVVGWTIDKGLINITILDDGPGIPPETLAHLGAPGVRLDEQMPGHGLGLAIARDLARAAGGQLVLGSRPDGVAGTSARLALVAG